MSLVKQARKPAPIPQTVGLPQRLTKQAWRCRGVVWWKSSDPLGLHRAIIVYA
jgi:hypothetical protein